MKKFKNLKIKHHMKLIKSDTSDKPFNFDDAKYIKNDFNGDAITITLQLTKTYFVCLNLNTSHSETEADELLYSITKRLIFFLDKHQQKLKNF